MALDIRKIALRSTSISELTEGKTQLKTKEIVSKFPDGITLTEFDVVPNNGKPYPVFLFKEEPTHYYNGGLILYNMVNEIVKECNDDLSMAREEFKNYGGLKVKLSQSETKAGNNLTSVEIL